MRVIQAYVGKYTNVSFYRIRIQRFENKCCSETHKYHFKTVIVYESNVTYEIYALYIKFLHHLTSVWAGGDATQWFVTPTVESSNYTIKYTDLLVNFHYVTK